VQPDYFRPHLCRSHLVAHSPNASAINCSAEGSSRRQDQMMQGWGTYQMFGISRSRFPFQAHRFTTAFHGEWIRLVRLAATLDDLHIISRLGSSAGHEAGKHGAAPRRSDSGRPALHPSSNLNDSTSHETSLPSRNLAEMTA
jgi:hypothetical protein